jgi:hypothetical protein
LNCTTNRGLDGRQRFAVRLQFENFLQRGLRCGNGRLKAARKIMIRGDPYLFDNLSGLKNYLRCGCGLKKLAMRFKDVQMF